MSLLFVAARMPATAWNELPFAHRVALVRAHYVTRPKWPGIVEREWFFPEAGIGIYIAYQNQPGKLFSHESCEGSRSDYISHAPFGYRIVAPGCRLERLPTALASMIDDDPLRMRDISPAQSIITVDQERQAFFFRNDLLALAKAYLLDIPDGEVIASRPIAAHLMAARKPELSNMGWAAQQLHGWHMNDLTPFCNIRKLLGGTIIRQDRDGLHETHNLHVAKWFTDPPTRSMLDGFERFMTEFAEFFDPAELDVCLSGGRDSRAAASLFLRFHSDRIRLRTNQPPALEGIIARQLVERLPNFDRHDTDHMKAFDANGRTIWEVNDLAVHAGDDIYARACQWAYAAEGMNVPGVIIQEIPPPGPIFSAAGTFIPTILGVAGEAAKAYYWSPRMVSGAYATSLSAFREDITTIKIGKRLQTHPLTIQSDLPFIDPDYRPSLRNMIYENQRKAGALGIHGYRFLDYWWLVERFGNATTTLSASSTMPFMVPEFLATALQQPPIERSRGQTLSKIVAHFRPQWNDVPYFDEIQNTVPRDQILAYQQPSILWEGNLAADFITLLKNSPALNDPYDRQAIISFFESDLEATLKVAYNVRAYGLVQRHAVWQLCEDIGETISAALRPN